MKNYKKFLAGTMAAVMVLGSSMVAFAAEETPTEGGTTGQGQLDIVKDSAIFNVVLPITPEDGNPSVLDYIIDPTGVIKATSAAKYAGKTFDPDGTLFFADSDATGSDTDYNYKPVSDELTATNKSTMDIDITVTISVAPVDGITLAGKSALTGDDAKIYLGYKDNKSKTTYEALTDAGVTATATMTGADAQYEVKYSAEKGYYKELKADATGFDTYVFSLEGACSAKGWDDLAEVAPPAVEAVWSVENPTITGPQMKVSKDGVITITNLTGEQNYSALSLAYNDGEKDKTATVATNAHTWDKSGWSKTEGGTLIITLNDTYKSALSGRQATFTLTLTSGDPVIAKQTLN